MKLRAEPPHELGWMCYKHRGLMNTFRFQYLSGDPLKGESHGEKFIVMARGPCKGGVCETAIRQRSTRD